MSKQENFLRGFAGFMSGTALYCLFSETPVRHWTIFAAVFWGLMTASVFADERK